MAAWKNPPTKFAIKFRKEYNDTAREAAIRILRGVIIRSPVDTGRFRGNWQVAEGSVPTGATDDKQPNQGIAMSAAIGKVPQDMVGKVLYIVNNLPYAQRLEGGWSDQAPNGMAALTLLEVRKWLKSQTK